MFHILPVSQIWIFITNFFNDLYLKAIDLNVLKSCFLFIFLILNSEKDWSFWFFFENIKPKPNRFNPVPANRAPLFLGHLNTTVNNNMVVVSGTASSWRVVYVRGSCPAGPNCKIRFQFRFCLIYDPDPVTLITEQGRGGEMWHFMERWVEGKSWTNEQLERRRWNDM